MIAKKRVFVTGGSSVIMRGVLAKLDPEKFEVVGLTRKVIRDSKRIKWLKGDLLNPESYRNAISECDIIIHAAAITHTKKERDYFLVNVEGTRNLCSLVSNVKPPLFVFISSRVAGEKSGAYGTSKLKAEEEVRALEKWLIIRPAEVYGGSKNEGVDKTIRSAMAGGLQACPIGDQSKMYPIHTNDVAMSIHDAVFESENHNRIQYVNGPEGFSFKELLNHVAECSNSRIILVPIPKLILQLVAIVAKTIPLDFGFVPDQVARLYACKGKTSPPLNAMRISDYIESLSKK